ncbi:uncharacterized protein LOC126324492 isoform X2 [Schistocerca gregaria]|uniref:uncharacterized protein LOC126324492 isoform X2 n=1 Tax=Schistocerca gregaria TaxID=7010 RepID=UPI00211E295C|nr:uncharacterized protein LOC126324492 isoform X2 [Schistocerca gregaria]
MNNSHVNLTCCTAHLFRQSPRVNETDTTPNVVHIKKNGISIGRDQNSVDVYLNSTYIPHVVSRVHAYILRSFGKWKIRDNRSSNGVFVNSRKIVDQVQLKDGDLLVFGSARKYYIDRGLQYEYSEYRYIFRINHLDPENKYEADDCRSAEARVQNLSSKDGGKAIDHNRQKRSRAEFNKLFFKEEDECISNMLKRVSRREPEYGVSATNMVPVVPMTLAINPGENCVFEQFPFPYVPSLEEYMVVPRKTLDMRLRRSTPLLLQGIPSRNLFQACYLNGESNGVFQNVSLAATSMSSAFGFSTVSSQRIENFEAAACSVCREAVFERVRLPCRSEMRFLPFLASDIIDRMVVGLNVGCPWNDQDRRNFFELLKRSIREPKFDYCRKIGLTSDWVELASNVDIIVACGNLDISIAEVANELAETENARSSASEVMAALRSELLQIVRSSGR